MSDWGMNRWSKLRWSIEILVYGGALAVIIVTWCYLAINIAMLVMLRQVPA